MEEVFVGSTAWHEEEWGGTFYYVLAIYPILE